MSEFDSVSQERLAQVERIVKAMYEGLVSKVVADIKALPKECRLSGDDSLLADFWEEFKYQMQREESFFFSAYEETIRGLCAGIVDGLDREQQGLLWLWSDGYFKYDIEDGGIPYGFAEEDLENELYTLVCDIASNEELAVDPDVEADLERHKEDLRLNLADWSKAEDPPGSST